ncbi:DUF819 family protein [Pontibacter chinhatensis]|uniref:Uncharacterized membrane protein n=1 Tax=Pontibacter chinhatensis TaxID=1436961 RepID=A0A1I2NMG0_9BACT|nr:DUF819 family protein [Pontibacter chinhatensis]SFG02471.1 Uncharacterized membrane protein [Pontibacter chinhatensis]
MTETNAPLLTNDAVVLGLLLFILAFVFHTSTSTNRFWMKFYRVVPSLLLCYFIPALFNTFNIISGDASQLYHVASRYFLPASLILLTLSIDFKSLRMLGSKAVIMFFAGTLGVMFGGPLALFLVGSVFPDILYTSGDEVWKGLSTISGSWIGGGANQAAMLEVFGASKDAFGQMIAVDVLVANVWMGVLLYFSQKPEKIDRILGADSRPIKELEARLEGLQEGKSMLPTTSTTIVLLGVAFGFTGISHLLADIIAPYFAENYPELATYSITSGFFWLVIIATTAGLILSFTKARNLESYGASRFGSVFLYFLVATIGMSMDLGAVLDNPKLFLVGAFWISFHVLIMLVVARIIKAPFFYVAVGSQANIGGAASAPIVAAAFNRYLAPVGVLLAVLGYAVGTYGGYLCGLMLQYVWNILA